MSSMRSRLHRSPLALAPLAAVLTLSLCMTHTAHATYYWYHTDSDGFTVVDELDDEGELIRTWVYGPDSEFISVITYDGNPSPDGQDTGLGPDQDAFDRFVERLKNMGGSLELEPDFWATPLGRAMTDDGKGSAVIDPWEFGAEAFEEDGGGRGGGGLGYNSGDIGDYIDRKKRTGGGSSDDDDDDDDGGAGGQGMDPQDLWGGASMNPEIVNPPPVPTSMVLLPPDAMGHNTGGAGDSSTSFDPTPIPWAAFGGAPGGHSVRPDATAITGGR